MEGDPSPDIFKSRRFTIRVVVCASALFVTLAVMLFLRMQKTVTIVDGEKVICLKTLDTTADGVLKQAGITLQPKDTVEPSLNSEIEEGSIIKITRAFPVYITCAGERRQVISGPVSVLQLLRNNGIDVGSKDRVEPSLERTVAEGTEIRIFRITEQLISEKRRIYYDLIKRKNDKLEKGVSRVIQQGHEGEKLVTYRAIYEDGKEISREVASEEVIKQKQDKIVEYGTIDSFTTSRGERVRFKKVISMTATAYHSGIESTGKTPDHPGYGITSTGIRAQKGVAAVDPRVIPLGTRLYVDGYGFAVAADTGSAIRGNRIDLYHDTYEEAKNYGRRRIKVYFMTD